MPVIGWKLDEAERPGLLERFPPLWPDVIADHITLDPDASASDPLPHERSAAARSRADPHHPSPVLKAVDLLFVRTSSRRGDGGSARPIAGQRWRSR